MYLISAPSVAAVLTGLSTRQSAFGSSGDAVHSDPQRCAESRRQVPYRFLLQLALLALVYFTAGWLSLLVSQQNLIVTVVIFAAEGFSLAVVLLFGYRLWPGIFAGQLALALALYAGIPLAAALAIAGDSDSRFGAATAKRLVR